jgi:hypothetical protein
VSIIRVLSQAKMKAAQDRFVVNYKPGEGDEAEAKRPKESGAASDELYEDAQVTSCALCRDAASTSPLCFLVLIQVLLALFRVLCLHLDILQGFCRA